MKNLIQLLLILVITNISSKYALCQNISSLLLDEYDVIKEHPKKGSLDSDMTIITSLEGDYILIDNHTLSYIILDVQNQTFFDFDLRENIEINAKDFSSPRDFLNHRYSFFEGTKVYFRIFKNEKGIDKKLFLVYDFKSKKSSILKCKEVNVGCDLIFNESYMRSSKPIKIKNNYLIKFDHKKRALYLLKYNEKNIEFNNVLLTNSIEKTLSYLEKYPNDQNRKILTDNILSNVRNIDDCIKYKTQIPFLEREINDLAYLFSKNGDISSKEKFVKNFKVGSSKVIEIQNQIDSYYKGQRVALENQRKEEESRKSKLKLYGPDAIHKTEWHDDSGMSWGNFKRCSIEYVDGTKGLVCLVGGVHTLDPGSLSAAKLEYSSFEFAAQAAYRLAKSEILPNEGRIWENRAGHPSTKWHTKNITYNDPMIGLVFDGKHLYYRPSSTTESKISPTFLSDSKHAQLADSEVINYKVLSEKWLLYQAVTGRYWLVHTKKQGDNNVALYCLPFDDCPCKNGIFERLEITGAIKCCYDVESSIFIICPNGEAYCRQFTKESAGLFGSKILPYEYVDKKVVIKGF